MAIVDVHLTCMVVGSTDGVLVSNSTVQIVCSSKTYPAEVIARGENPLYCHSLGGVFRYRLVAVRTATSDWWIAQIK